MTIETAPPPGYRAGRLSVFQGMLTTKKRKPRKWVWHESTDRQRVIRDPIIVFIRRVK